MLDRILLSRFRNHRETAVEGTAQFNLLVGENGAGKTNVLEAISLLAPGRGLRRAQLADMPGQGFDSGFAVSADLAPGGGDPVRLGTGVQPERPGRRLVQRSDERRVGQACVRPCRTRGSPHLSKKNKNSCKIKDR